VFTEKRSRAQGAAAQEMEFSDLGEGVADWASTPEAKEFLPAPSTPARPQPRPGAQTAQRGAQQQQTKPAETMADAAAATVAQLQEQGINPLALFNE
jgi:hypothetical protein